MDEVTNAELLDRLQTLETRFNTEEERTKLFVDKLENICKSHDKTIRTIIYCIFATFIFLGMFWLYLYFTTPPPISNINTIENQSGNVIQHEANKNLQNREGEK